MTQDGTSENLTRILQEVESGRKPATEELFPIVYDELRRIAQKQMNRETPGHTLQATALVNEAYLKLMTQDKSTSWNSRGHFFSAAAEAMRQLLVDHARRRLAEKRGGQLERKELPDIALANQLSPERMLIFDEALERFCAEDPVKGKLVKLRCFAGLDRESLSNALDLSLATIDRYWKYAKVRLYCELADKVSEDSMTFDLPTDTQ